MNSYKQLFLHYLEILKEEISLFKNEDDIRKLSGQIKNTPGNLCLHICGNLNHYLGATIGNTGYIRNRDLEFSRKDYTIDELLKQVDDTVQMLTKLFDSMKYQDLRKTYPQNYFGENRTYGDVIAILISHLAYHIGQINYHRRILDN